VRDKINKVREYVIEQSPDGIVPGGYESCVFGAYKSTLAAMDPSDAQELHQELLAVFLRRSKAV
jgi:hypothetical protein